MIKASLYAVADLIESRTRDMERMDVIIDYAGRNLLLNLKSGVEMLIMSVVKNNWLNIWSFII